MPCAANPRERPDDAEIRIGVCLEVRPMDLPDGVGVLGQQSRRPQRARQILSAVLHFRGQSAIHHGRLARQHRCHTVHAPNSTRGATGPQPDPGGTSSGRDTTRPPTRVPDMEVVIVESPGAGQYSPRVPSALC